MLAYPPYLTRNPFELIRPFILNGLSNARAISQPFWGWKRHAHSTTRSLRFPDWFAGIATRG